MADKAKCAQCGATFSLTAMYQSRVTHAWYCKHWDACDERMNAQLRKRGKFTVQGGVTSNVRTPDPVLEQNC